MRTDRYDVPRPDPRGVERKEPPQLVQQSRQRPWESILRQAPGLRSDRGLSARKQERKEDRQEAGRVGLLSLSLSLSLSLFFR